MHDHIRFMKDIIIHVTDVIITTSINCIVKTLNVKEHLMDGYYFDGKFNVQVSGEFRSIRIQDFDYGSCGMSIRNGVRIEFIFFGSRQTDFFADKTTVDILNTLLKEYIYEKFWSKNPSWDKSNLYSAPLYNGVLFTLNGSSDQSFNFTIDSLLEFFKIKTFSSFKSDKECSEDDFNKAISYMYDFISFVKERKLEIHLSTDRFSSDT